MVDYNKEVEQAQESGAETFKPETGSYKIEILDEPIETEFIENEGKQDEKRIPQWKIPIKVDNINKSWFVSKGKTLSSVQKQLALIGKNKNGLKGETINLLVKYDGQRNEYTIIEAVELQKKAK